MPHPKPFAVLLSTLQQKKLDTPSSLNPNPWTQNPYTNCAATVRELWGASSLDGNALEREAGGKASWVPRCAYVRWSGNVFYAEVDMRGEQSSWRDTAGL